MALPGEGIWLANTIWLILHLANSGILAYASTESTGRIAITIVIGETYSKLRINLSSIVSSKREDYIMNDTGVMSRTVWVLYHGLVAGEYADEPLNYNEFMRHDKFGTFYRD